MQYDILEVEVYLDLGSDLFWASWCYPGTIQDADHMRNALRLRLIIPNVAMSSNHEQANYH